MRPRGSGRVFKRGTRYWIAFYDGQGKEQRESAGTKLDANGRRAPKSEREARDLVHDRLASVHQGTWHGRAAQRLTVKEVLDAYKVDLEARGKKSVDKIVSHLKPVRVALDDERVLGLTVGMLTNYMAQRRAQHAAGGNDHAGNDFPALRPPPRPSATANPISAVRADGRTRRRAEGLRGRGTLR